MRVLSAVTDPNDYAGPGTGYRPTAQRQALIDGIWQQRDLTQLRAEQQRWAGQGGGPARRRGAGHGPAGRRDRHLACGGPRDPASRTLSGMPVIDVLGELPAGLEEEGCHGRVVRVNNSIDLGQIGLTAARLAGSGIGIGLQGKGTALIHRRDLSPLANLELYSIAPVITADLYRMMGINAGRRAKNATAVPVRNPYTDEAVEARYHTAVVGLVALERGCQRPSDGPEEVEVRR